MRQIGKVAKSKKEDDVSYLESDVPKERHKDAELQAFAAVDSLVVKAKAGDEQAKLNLLSRYQPLLQKHSHHHGRAIDDSENIEAEAQFILIDAIDKFSQERGVNFTVYLKLRLKELSRYTWNNSFRVKPPARAQQTFWKELKRDNLIPGKNNTLYWALLSVAAEEVSESDVGSVSGPLDRIEWLNLKARLRTAMNELTPVESRRIKSYFLANKEQRVEDVASSEGVSVTAVRKSINTGISKLKRILIQ